MNLDRTGPGPIRIGSVSAQATSTRRRLRVWVIALVCGFAALSVLPVAGWFVIDTSRVEPPPTPEALSERFGEDRRTFETLRDMFVDDRRADSSPYPPRWDIRTDCYSWVDPCDSCEEAASDASGALRMPVVGHGGVPGVSAPCDYIGGCMRWVDAPPTPSLLAGIRPFSASRANVYLEGLEALGVVWLRSRNLENGPLRVNGTQSIEFVVDMRGTMLSGSSTAITWAPDPEQRHPSDVPIDDAPGWFVRVSH